MTSAETTSGEGATNRMLDRVAAILDAVGAETLTATEIAQRTGLSKSTAHRVVQAMEAYEFLSKHRSGGYSLGRRMLALPLQAYAAPYLIELRDQTGETAQFWIRQGDKRVCVESIDSTHRLRITAEAGLVYPLHGSAGKILGSADLSETLQDRGWAESVEERTPGLSSVSAPVLRNGAVVGAVCLAVPVARIQQSPGQDYGEQVIRAAQNIGRILTMQR